MVRTYGDNIVLDLDLPTLVTFLCEQATTLSAGLEGWERSGPRSLASRLPEPSHDHWLACIAVTERSFGGGAAQRLVDLYSLHGRARARIERRLDPLLDPRLARAVREVLQRELETLNAGAVSALLDLPELSISGRCFAAPPPEL